MLDQTPWAPRGIASTGCRWYLTATWPDCGVINGAKKKGRGSFPEQMPQPQAGKGCVGTSQPCSQETKLMGSCLELQAVCWGEKKPGSGKKSLEHLLAALEDQGSTEEGRAASSTLPVHAGCCDSDHSPAGLSVPWLVRRRRQPRGCGLSCTNRRLQPRAPEPTRRVV